MFKSALTLVLAYAVLVTLLLWQAPRYGELWVPLYQWELGAISTELDINNISVVSPQGERVVMLDAEVRAGSVFGHYFFQSAAPLISSTLLGHVLLHPIVMLLIVLAWPAAFQRKGLYLLAAIPFLVVVELLDVPLVLLGSLQDLVLFNTAPDALRFAPLVNWMNLLNGGGRIALSVAAALLAIASVQTFAPLSPARFETCNTSLCRRLVTKLARD